MFPLNSVCSFVIFLRNVTTRREVRSLVFEGTTTVESDWIILINLSEVLLGLGEGSDLRVLGEDLRGNEKE